LEKCSFEQLIHADDRSRVLSRHKRRLAGEAVPNNYSIRVIDKAGGVKWIELNAVRIEWEGRPAVISFSRDITSQKRLESQLLQSQKMEAVGTLAGGIAHDFNNSLQAISGFTQLLLMDEAKSRQDREMLATIQKAARHAEELTRQLLTFSHKIESKPVPLNLNVEIRETCRLLERTLPKMIQIETRLKEDLSIVQVDKVQLEQVIMNLGINAGHAMPDGGRLIIETEDVVLTNPPPLGDHDIAAVDMSCYRSGIPESAWTIRPNSTSSTRFLPPGKPVREPDWGWRWSTGLSRATAAGSLAKARRARGRLSGFTFRRPVSFRSIALSMSRKSPVSAGRRPS
jgi:hypothetical protein